MNSSLRLCDCDGMRPVWKCDTRGECICLKSHTLRMPEPLAPSSQHAESSREVTCLRSPGWPGTHGRLPQASGAGITVVHHDARLLPGVCPRVAWLVSVLYVEKLRFACSWNFYSAVCFEISLINSLEKQNKILNPLKGTVLAFFLSEVLTHIQ